MTKTVYTKLQQAFEDFNYAGQALSTLLQQKGEIEEKAIKLVEEQYPFFENFDTISYKIHNWCEAAIEQIEHEQIQEYCKEKHYVMAKRSVTNGDDYVEEGWFFYIKPSDDYGKVKLCEEIEGGCTNFSWGFVKNEFIEIPKELYDLAYSANSEGDYEAIQKIKELSRIIGRTVDGNFNK